MHIAKGRETFRNHLKLLRKYSSERPATIDISDVLGTKSSPKKSPETSSELPLRLHPNLEHRGVAVGLGINRRYEDTYCTNPSISIADEGLRINSLVQERMEKKRKEKELKKKGDSRNGLSRWHSASRINQFEARIEDEFSPFLQKSGRSTGTLEIITPSRKGI